MKRLRYLCLTFCLAAGMSAAGGCGRTQGGLGEDMAVREIYDVMTVPYMKLQAEGDGADAALDRAAGKIKSIDKTLSTGDPESEIGSLNEKGSGVLGEDASYLLKESLALYEETEGCFDISVYPLMELWGFTGLYKSTLEQAEDAAEKVKTGVEAEETREAPSDEQVKEALKKTGALKIRFDSKTGQVTLPEGMKIDFGGIGKGYASQCAADILREMGVSSAIMDLGGNIQTVGRKPDGGKWRVALNDRNHGGFLGILSVEDAAVITSGGYERNFTDAKGKKYHHILDPKTGYPVDNGFSVDSSVTIVCGDGTMADALSTAMYAAGPEKAMEYWREHSEEFQMILMTDQDHLYVTEGIEKDFQSDYSYDVIGK